MIYCFDLDGTICTTGDNHDYSSAIPIDGMVQKINELYKNNYIKIFTARGATSGIDWSELTKKQIHEWGIKHHELI
jgi:histidinol phosphatase-like enzyme